jgi:hypothetical protein
MQIGCLGYSYKDYIILVILSTAQFSVTTSLENQYRKLHGVSNFHLNQSKKKNCTPTTSPLFDPWIPGMHQK